jgi:phage-related protein
MDKPVVWIGQSKKELLSMPDDVKDEFGYAIGEAQAGRTASSAKPMSGNVRDVMEIVSNEKGDTFRAMYTTKLAGRVYVLAAFQKKSKSGIATPRADIDRVLERLKAAKALHRKVSLSQK